MCIYYFFRRLLVSTKLSRVMHPTLPPGKVVTVAYIHIYSESP